MTLRPLLVVGLLLSGAVSDTWAKPCPMPTSADMGGVWVGEAGGAFFHLEIDTDATGVLAVQFLEGREPDAWRIHSVDIANRRIEFRLEPTSQSTEPLFLRGTGCHGVLFLKVGSVRPNWKWDITLRPQRVLQERLSSTSDKVADVRTQYH